MVYGLYSVVTGSLAQERRLEVLTHNLANATTVGFKGNVPVFEVVSAPFHPTTLGSPRDHPLRPVFPLSFIPETYVAFTGAKADMSPGELRGTGNPLDLAIEGRGWFSIETSQGTRYTRNGSFTLDSRGLLVTHHGWPVIGNNGPITVQGSSVKIDSHGIITVDGQEIDRLKIVEAPRDDAFQRAENSLFATKPGATVREATTDVAVKQGFLELSNVNPIKGMTTLIEAMRAYESYQKVLQTWSETTSRVVNEVGRLR